MATQRRRLRVTGALVASLAVVITIMVTGCSHSSPHGNGDGRSEAKVGPTPPITDSHGHIATIQVVLAGKYNNWYELTREAIFSVGKEYGLVSNNPTSQGPGGIFSNVLSPGTKLYEIPGVDPSSALAVPWKDGKYLKAVRKNK